MLCRHHRNPLWPLALLCLVVLVGPPAHADYRKKAEEQTSWIQAHYYDAVAKKYRDSYPVDPKALPWTLMWANGVQWRVLAAAARYDPAQYRPILDDFGQGLREYWDPQPKGTPPGFNAYCSGPGGDDKYYDDNAWLVLGYLEAYEATHDPKYRQWARETQTFVLSGWDDKLGGGIYWSLKHQGKATAANAPASVGALRLAALGDTEQRDWALRIVNWVDATLKADNGLYWDNIALDGKVEKTEWTYNTGLMIQADLLLFQTQGDRKALGEAERSADAAIATWQDLATGAFTNNANFTHLLCEGLLRLYQADHDIRYLDAVRRHAAFGYRYVRDAQGGGYWNDWTKTPHKADERKALLENASDARLFWLLAPYPDVDMLYDRGVKAAASGHDAAAQGLLQQAADSDTEAVEARYRLWRVLQRERKSSAAQAQAQKLVAASADPGLKARLTAIGWKPPSAGQ